MIGAAAVAARQRRAVLRSRWGGEQAGQRGAEWRREKLGAQRGPAARLRSVVNSECLQCREDVTSV